MKKAKRLNTEIERYLVCATLFGAFPGMLFGLFLGVSPARAEPVPEAAEPVVGTLPALAAPEPGAAVGTAGPRLTLKQAVFEALQRNPAMRGARYGVEAAGFQKDAAEWARYPAFSASIAGYAGAGKYATDPGSAIRLDQPIWAGGRISAGIDAADRKVAASEAAQAEMRQRVAEQATLAYVDWLRAIERLDIARRGGTEINDLVQHVKRKQEAGQASPADVSIALARYSTAMNQVTELQGALEQSKVRLKNITLLPELGAGEPQAIPPWPGKGIEGLEQDYLLLSPLLRQRHAEIEAAEAEQRVRRGSMLPTVSVRLERIMGAGGIIAGQKIDDSRALLQLTYTPDAGLASWSNYQVAGAQVAGAQAQLETDRNEYLKKARAHHSDYTVARQKVAILEPEARAMELIAQSFRRQFEAGRKSWMDVLNIYKEATDTKLSLSQAQNQLDQATLQMMLNDGSFWPWLEGLGK